MNTVKKFWALRKGRSCFYSLIEYEHLNELLRSCSKGNQSDRTLGPQIYTGCSGWDCFMCKLQQFISVVCYEN